MASVQGAELEKRETTSNEIYTRFILLGKFGNGHLCMGSEEAVKITQHLTVIENRHPFIHIDHIQPPIPQVLGFCMIASIA